jgi:hypothetical protein
MLHLWFIMVQLFFDLRQEVSFCVRVIGHVNIPPSSFNTIAALQPFGRKAASLSLTESSD